jgi:hypothetical protein
MFDVITVLVRIKGFLCQWSETNYLLFLGLCHFNDQFIWAIISYTLPYKYFNHVSSCFINFKWGWNMESLKNIEAHISSRWHSSLHYILLLSCYKIICWTAAVSRTLLLGLLINVIIVITAFEEMPLIFKFHTKFHRTFSLNICSGCRRNYWGPLVWIPNVIDN